MFGNKKKSFFEGNSKAFEDAYKGILDEQLIEKARRKREREEEDEFAQAIRLGNSHKKRSSIF
jgi:hypothetical protein